MTINEKLKSLSNKKMLEIAFCLKNDKTWAFEFFWDHDYGISMQQFYIIVHEEINNRNI